MFVLQRCFSSSIPTVAVFDQEQVDLICNGLIYNFLILWTSKQGIITASAKRCFDLEIVAANFHSYVNLYAANRNCTNEFTAIKWKVNLLFIWQFLT